jgi:hypothetical protein
MIFISSCFLRKVSSYFYLLGLGLMGSEDGLGVVGSWNGSSLRSPFDDRMREASKMERFKR